MPAPRLNFDDEEEKKKESGGAVSPAPPLPGLSKKTYDALPGWAKDQLDGRDASKHSFLSNAWAGVESIVPGVLSQEEQARHAIASDIAHSRGAFGLASIPLHAGYLATKYAVTGDKGDLKKIKKVAKGPWQKERSAFDVVAEGVVKGTYESTRVALGTRGSKKFKEMWHDNPVAALGSALIVAPPAFRLAGISKMATTIRAANRVPLKGGGTRAMTRAEALKAATVESYYPGSLDHLDIKGSPFAPRISGRKVSRTPTGRGAQRAFDWTSEKIDKGIGVGERKTGPDTPLSATRREAAGARRADDLNRSRLVTNAMRHVSTFADYLNDGLGARIGTALGGRRETLAARDAAVGAALHASSAVDPVEAVRLAAEDTKAILQSGQRDAHNGDIADVVPDKRVGQTVYVTHGIDENGAPIREKATVTADHGDRVTVDTPSGEKTIPHARAHLLGPNGEGQIPLNPDEIKMLERRYDHLTTAHDELTTEPRLQEKFRAATQTMADLGQMNEQLGVDYFTRGLDPTGSEAMAIRERLDARRNQFLDRLGGEGPQINYDAGLWGDMQKAMQKHGGYTDEQQLVFMSIMDRQARLWANEVEGRDPADYLSSPEGANLGGIDFSKPEDLEATANAMFQREGERHHLVKTTTSVLITGPPKVGDLVSTPKGMGVVHEITTGSEGNVRLAWIDMNEGGAYRESFPLDQVRVSSFPWRGHPQVNDYVITPEGVGRLEQVEEGPGPSFENTYTVTLFDDVNGMFVDGEAKTFGPGQVQRVEDPRNPTDETTPIFHITSQQALSDPKFPTKATVEQYLKAFEKAGVKAEEFYWMGLTALPMLKGEATGAKAVFEKLQKEVAEDPERTYRYYAPGEERENPPPILGSDLLEIRRQEMEKTAARLEQYIEEPDPDFILDADYGGKSFPVQAIRDKVESRALFLDIKETLFSSKASSSTDIVRWGEGQGNYGNGGLIMRTPTADEPYYELLLQLPHNELGLPNPHWHGVEHPPVVHIRFHEIVDNEGVNSILVDEKQSDVANRGRKYGFRDMLTPRDKAMVKHLRDKERRLLELVAKVEEESGMSRHDVDSWYERQIQEKAVEMNAEIDARNAERNKRLDAAVAAGEPTTGPEFARENRLFTYGADHARIAERLEEEWKDDPAFKDMRKLQRRYARLARKQMETRVAADAIETGGGLANAVNRGPFVMGDSARYLAMKRLIRWAADHGQTRIIWTRGHEHGVRYGKFNSLQIDDSGHGGHQLNPDDYQDEFSFPKGDVTIYLGKHYRSSDLTPSRLYRMQQAQPVEIKWDDLEEYGDQFVLMPNGHPNDVPGGIPGQMSLIGEPDIPVNPARHERWAEIVSQTDDGVVVKPIDPEWDPATFEVDYRGLQGDSGYGTFDVHIVNRVGDTIYRDTVEGYIGGKSDLLKEVQKDWERTLRNWSPSGQSITETEANIVKMEKTIEILNESETFDTELTYMFDNPEFEFDQYAFDEYAANYEGDEDSYGESHGDIAAIRDHEPTGTRRVNEIKQEIATLERQLQEDIQRGARSRDYDKLIRQTKVALKQAEENVENYRHSQGYDVMEPNMARRFLKPYGKEPDATPVEIKKEIYKGRYGMETRGKVSEEGNIHGWAMDLPKKMLDDAKEDTTSLFQRGNDIVKGASTWVGGPDGKRFVALTEHADFSTLMHEFIGHATEEMKRRYPELWEAVEVDMKKPLEKWTVADHEKFAKYVERYWMEGKAPSPELATVMKMVKEWMKGVYASITQLGRPMPDSTRILLNRHLGQGITARPGARAFVPHVSQFDTMMDTAPGGTRLAAGGNVVGVPQVDRRNFGAKRNRGILWQSGELALSARPIIDQYFRRTKFMETEAVRQELFDAGHLMPKNGRPPKGAWLVRNPEKGPERLTARNKSRLSEEDFSRLIGEGDTPEEFVTKMEEIRKGHYAAPGEHPDWANDLENVRWVEGGKVNQRIQNVFPSAPRGRGAAGVGSVNALARLTGIYLRPLHYLVGNIPQNVLMVALTNPGALVNSAKYGAYSFLPRVMREMAMQPRDLFVHDRFLYNQIKTETGDIQAGAGLPDFYTLANNRFQKGERRLNKISRGSAEKLGELADQPYRVSVWMAHAKSYGFNTPDEWRELINSERGTPEARIRDDIAQMTREDMIDFNTLSPWERQNVSRYFYLWAFTRGFAKWPVTFAREYPGRTGFAMTQADSERTDDNGVPLSWLPASGVLKSNKGKGKVRDLGFLDPTAGLRQQVETGIQLAHGNFQGIGGMTTPPLETSLQAITGGPRAPKGGLRGLADQLARDTVPFYDIGRKTATPGLGVSDRVWAGLDFRDRFGVKPEIGRGKNAEKKRLEDEKIQRFLKAVDRPDMLAEVMHQQDAYWHHKYLEQQIRFGAQARRKGTALNDREKLTILYATAADYFPQTDLPKLSEVLKASPAEQESLRADLSDFMFGARNEALNS